MDASDLLADEQRLAALTRIGAALRRANGGLRRTALSTADLDALAAAAEAVAGRIAGALDGAAATPRGQTPADRALQTVFGAFAGEGNAVAPPIRSRVVDGRVEGTVVFGAAYEGAPGVAHGGITAAVFDHVLGELGDRPAMTGTLTVRYRRPQPLHRELQFTAWLERTDGRKRFGRAQLFDGEQLLAEAEAVFIVVSGRRFVQLTAERDAE